MRRDRRQTQRRQWIIEAAGATPPSAFALTCAAEISIHAAKDGEDAKRPTFSMKAYNGGLLRLGGFYRPVVIDLSGLTASPRVPILLDHSSDQIVGQAQEVEIGARGVKLSGVITGEDQHATKVTSHARNGFEWQASVGVDVQKFESVGENSTVKVNDRSFDGPLLVARKGRLREVSFVAVGADETASAKVAAEAAGETDMNLKAWLKAKGIENFDELSEAVQKAIRAQFEADLKAAGKVEQDEDGNDIEAAAGEDDEAESVEADADADDAQDDEADADPKAGKVKASASAEDISKAVRLEATRRDKIRELCGNEHSKIAAKAIEEGWTVEATAARLYTASRSGVNTIRPERQGARHAAVIAAAICLSAGLPAKIVAEDIAATDRERVMNAAQAGDMRGYSIHALMDETIRAAGTSYHGSRKSDAFIRAAFQAERTIRASGGFSTVSLSGILSTVANKGMLASYSAVETVWQKFCAVRNHGDFKVHTRYRLDSTGAFKKVAADGELKHVGLSDASYTNQLGTFGAIIALTRQMMINDDLGAFMEIPALLGRMAALRIEEAAFVLLLSNPSSFFAAGNKNYLSGGSSALSIASLASLEKKFRDQVDSNGKPVLVSPKVLLVGSTLATDAQNIFDEKVIIASGLSATNARTVEPAKNKMYNKYAPVVSPYIDNTAIKDQDGAAITGQSSTAFYLFADPAVRAAIAVAFLNGQQTPTLESAETDFNTLGMQWRGYHDFGVGMEDPVAAALSAGA